MRRRCGTLPDSRCTGRLRHELGCTEYISRLRGFFIISEPQRDEEVDALQTSDEWESY